LVKGDAMGLICSLFGHRQLSDEFVIVDIGGAKFYLNICIRCSCFVGKPANKYADFIFKKGVLPLANKGDNT
jgi:hypothetical protein